MKKIIYLVLLVLIIGCSSDDNNPIDTIAPVITLLGEPIVVLNSEIYIDAGATAMDNVDGDITENIVVIGDVNVSVPDSYTLSYNVSDAAGNTASISRIVNVIEALDTIAPVITLIGEANISILQFNNYIDEGATATDNVDGDITYNIVTTGEVNTIIVGIYTITYTVSDAAGYTTTALREVTVVENNEANPVYLDENGITIKAKEWAEVGAIGEIDGVMYTVVDEAMLRIMIENEENLTQLATTKVTNMSELFFIGEGIYSDFNQDIKNWDVGNATNMSSMFENSSFNQPLENWDVSNVTNMSSMFRGSNFNQPIGNWDVSNVTDMSWMFRGTTFNQPIGDWDVSNVTDMSDMFFSAGTFNQPIGDWDVSSVIMMDSMFQYARLFNQPIGDWDVSHVTSMKQMFGGNQHEYLPYEFNQPIGNWDVSNVTNMSGMFEKATKFNQPIGNWDVSNVTDMSNMFSNDYFYNYDFNQPIGDWDVSNVTDMSGMFRYNYYFNQSIGDWDVSSVTDMSGMFGNCGFNQPIGDWDVSNVTTMSAMFYENIVFNQTIGTWNVSNVTNMGTMFHSSRFNQPIGNWNVSNVTTMAAMFMWTDVFNQDLSLWNVGNVILCSSFDYDTPQWVLPKPIFTNCTP